MKNLFSLILISLLTSLAARAQVGSWADQLKPLLGRHLVSVIEKTTTTEEVKDSKPLVASGGTTFIVNFAGGERRNKYFLSTKLASQPAANTWTLATQVKRLQRRIPVMDGDMMEVDTDNNFSDDPIANEVTNNQARYINRPYTLTFDQPGKLIEAKDAKPSVRAYLRDARLAMHPLADLSGMLQPLPGNFGAGTKTWTDTITSENGRYVNKYQVLAYTPQAVTLQLESNLLPGTGLTETDTLMTKGAAQNTQARDLNRRTQTIRLGYTGQITFDPSTGLIGVAKLTGEAEREVTLMGKATTLIDKFTYYITNRIEK
jgi:hypothetical protein